MSENSGTQVSNILAAFSIGALAGVGLALLYAPRSGKETRDLIADKSRELKGKAEETIKETRDLIADKSRVLKDKAEETIHDAQEFIGDKKAVLIAAVKAGKEAVCEERAKHQEIAKEGHGG